MKKGDINTPETCGNCRFNRCTWMNEDKIDFYCGNVDSDNFGFSTAYTDTCEEWEVRE